jgi:hypothetical protein
MNGGKIIGNSASYGGGGVFVFTNSLFTMNGGEISGNTYGGVDVRYSTFIMNGGKISGNTGGNGGGVFVAVSTFTMNGGEISGNTSLTTMKGGGLYLNTNAVFTMSGGTIYGSTANLPVGANASLANSAWNCAALHRHTSCTAQYGIAGGPYTNFDTSPANGGLTEDNNNGTSRTLNVDPNTGVLTVTPGN